MVILDTCAIIEGCKESPSFSPKTSKQIEGGAYVLSISFAEIACKIKLGKLELDISPRALYREYNQIDHLKIIDIGANEWFDAVDLQWNENKDPVDRIITAYASIRGLAIVSTDKKIKAFYKKVIW